MNRTTSARRGFASEGQATARGGRTYRSSRRGLYQNKGEAVYLYVDTPNGPRVGGTLVQEEELTLRKFVNFATHCLRLPELSWAIDADLLKQAQEAGATRVEIQDERGRRWWSSITYLLERGEVLDRGWGRQIRLPLNHFSFLPSPLEAQLSLLGEGGA